MHYGLSLWDLLWLASIKLHFLIYKRINYLSINLYFIQYKYRSWTDTKQSYVQFSTVIIKVHFHKQAERQHCFVYLDFKHIATSLGTTVVWIHLVVCPAATLSVPSDSDWPVSAAGSPAPSATKATEHSYGGKRKETSCLFKLPDYWDTLVFIYIKKVCLNPPDCWT